MIITKHQANDRGIIRIHNVIRLLTMGLQKNVPTIWAVTDPLMQGGFPMSFVIKNDGAKMTPGECERYVTSFISNEGDGVFHLIGGEQETAPMSPPLGHNRGGPRRTPDDGKVLA